MPLWLEMMGRDKRYGNRMAHLCDLIREHPDLGIVPDLAHLAEMGNNEQTIFGQALLKDTIRMVHCSLAGCKVPHALQKRWYGREDIDHVPAVLQPEAVNTESARSAARFPMVLEGAIPAGQQGLDILAAETRWWKALHSK